MTAKDPSPDAVFFVGRTAAFTIVARNYLAMARSLLDSLAEFEPEFERFVFIVDDIAQIEALDEGRVLHPVDVFEPAAYNELVRGYDVTELATAVKPSVMRYLLDRGFDRVLYFDPDIQVFAPLDPVVEPLAANDIVLTPHLTDAQQVAGRVLFELVIMRTGIYNLGFIGVRNTPNARAMLAWWGDRLAEFSRKDVQSGIFVDQRWVDLVPGLFPRTAVVRHRGCNIAYWNLHARRLAGDDELRLESGEPVVFFHFSGFDARRPERLCNVSTRIRLADEPRLARLLESYSARLIERGYLERIGIPYGLPVPFKARLRALGRRLFAYRSRVRYST